MSFAAMLLHRVSRSAESAIPFINPYLRMEFLLKAEQLGLYGQLVQICGERNF